MGDSGSMFVGFMVAALYVRGAQQTEGVPLLTPLLALSLPIVLRRCQELLAQQPARRAVVDARRGEIAARHEALRTRWRKEAEKDWDDSPIGTARLAHEVWEVIKGEDWVLTAGDLNGWAHRTWDFDKVYRFAPNLNARQLESSCLWLRREANLDTDGFIDFLRSQHLTSNVDLAVTNPFQASLRNSPRSL